VNLVKEDVMKMETVFALLDELISRFMVAIATPNTKPVSDELSEILFIVMTHAKEELKTDEAKWKKYVEHVQQVTKMKQCADNGLTSKCIFKYMDLCDSVC